MLRSTFSLPHNPPAPVSASWRVGSDFVDITFDKPLAPGPLDFANWTARHGPNDWSCTAAVAVGSVVTCTMAVGLEQAPAEWVTYAPPPFDVVSRRGFAAVAFTEFGLT